MSKQAEFRWRVKLFILAAMAIAGAIALSTAPRLDAPRPRRALLPNGGIIAAPAGQSGDKAITGPLLSEPVYPAVRNIDLRDLPQVGPTEKNHLLPEFERPGRAAAGRTDDAGPVDDPVAQKTFGPDAMPAPLQGFAGLDFAGWGGGWPPDTNGDVGPVYYIQTVNTSIGIYDKATGVRAAAFTINAFFDGTGTPCDANNMGDPIVLYDAAADRWIITDFAWSNLMSGPYYECIAVSQTGDPVSGGWYQYGYVAHNTYLADYPKLGVWPDAYYMSMNLFDCLNTSCSSASWQGVQVYAFNRADLLAGLPLTAVYFNLSAASNYFALLPSNLRGAQPPAGSPNYFVSADDGVSALHLWRFHVDWTTPANSTFTGPTDLTPAAYVMPTGTVPAQGGAALDTLGDRLMMQLQYRNIGGVESLWVNHTVSTGGVTGIRWYELRTPATTPVIYQQGTYQPDATYRWMGSLAVDRQGNIAVGYSVSSASMYPTIRYAGRLASDPLGQLSQGETTFIAGAGSQTSYNRWGDYSALSVDPVDDCTFWYTTEYYAATGTNWQTYIGSFQFPSCVSSNPILAASGVSTSDATGGNNNGVVEPGESIRLNIGLNNAGIMTATNVNGSVSVLSGNAVMLNPASAYADVAPAATVTNTTPYTFAVSTQLVCGAPITFALTATYNPTYTYNYTFSVSTGAPASAQNFQYFDGVTAPALPSGWTTSTVGAGAVPWVTSIATSDSAPNNAFTPDPASVTESNLVSPVFTPTISAAKITFRNNYILENTYDGAVLEIKIGAGAFTDIVTAGGSFTSGGYNGTISASYGNPLAGRSAWTGNSGGYITSTVTLPASAAGQGVQLRWRVGTDSSVGSTGQRIDTITLTDGYVCAPYLAPHTYADPALVCAGNAPCYSTPQAALNGVIDNGFVTIYGTHNVAAALISGNSGANDVTIDGTGTLNWTGGASALFNVGAGNVTVKGLTLTNASTVFNQTGGVLTAYANNLMSFATAYSGSGAHNLGHNYWGTRDPLAAAPTGFSADEWAGRLGAPVAQWAEGAGSAVLVTGANTATLSGGGGTAVVVSFGRGQANAPFDNGVAPYVDQMCSDFYDLFTVSGSGTWTAQIPVDNEANCNANTLTPERLGWITSLAQCSPTTNPACWNAVDPARLSVSGQNLIVSGLTVSELGGTPFVAGDINGSDPTAVQLTRLRARGDAWLPVLFIGLALMVSLSLGTVAIKRLRA